MISRLFAAGIGLWIAAAPAWADTYSDFWDAIRRDYGRGLATTIAKGMDPNTVAPDGDPALVAALRARSPEAVEVLLTTPGLKPDAPSTNGETALMLAAIQGKEPLVRRLLALGAQPRSSGWTALHYAATGGHQGIVKLLLEAGAPVDPRTAGGVTPLMLAARENHSGIVEALLAARASKNLCTDRQLNAADFARKAGHERLAGQLAASAPCP